MPPSKAKQATVAQRRREMLIMKIQGRTALEIAEHFEMSPNTARSDLSRAIKKAKDLEAHEAGMYRFIQGARLEQLLRAVWPEAEEGDLRAGEQARKYIADITELFGLKIPVRTEISGPDGGTIPFSGGEVSELVTLFGLTDHQRAELPGLPDDDTEDDPEDAEQDDDDDDG